MKTNTSFHSAMIAIMIAFFGAAVAVTVSTGNAQQHTHAKADVLSIGGSVTEIIYALGQGHRLLARDTTSTFPMAATHLPDVGYIRALSPEGVLSVAPKLIISEEGAGPPEAVKVLQDAALPFVTIPDAFSRAGIVAKIRAVGAALDVAEAAETLAQHVDADLLDAQTKAAAKATAKTTDAQPKRVLFILSTQGGRIMASGTNTAADSIITMAGGVNAVTAFDGYKPLTDEAVGAAAPDVILMMDRGGDHSGDHGAANAELFAMPAILTTPAAATQSVIRMDGLYLLGFGPRTAQAVTEISTYLYGK